MARGDRERNRGGRVEFDPKLFASICGLEGAGKTKFACSMPGEILYLAIDPNSAETVHNEQEVQPDKAIHYRQFDLPGIAFNDRDEVQNEAQRVYEEFVDIIRPIIKREAEAPTSIVLDTAGKFYDLHLMAEHGKSMEIPQFARSKSNARWESFLMGLKQSGSHVVLLHRLGQKYETRTVRTSQGPKEESVPVPGEWKRKGFTDAGYCINTEAYLFHDPEREDAEKLEDQYGMRIVRCTSRPSLIGKEVWGTNTKGESKVTFDRLFRMVYPDADRE